MNPTKYAHVISDLLKRINFHVDVLIYCFPFYLILRLYILATLKEPIPPDPASATSSLTLGRHHSHKVEPFSSPISVYTNRIRMKKKFFIYHILCCYIACVSNRDTKYTHINTSAIFRNTHKHLDPKKEYILGLTK